MSPDSERHQLPTYPPVNERMSTTVDDQEPLLDGNEDESGKATEPSDMEMSIWRLRASFFLFGTINNG